MTQRSSARLARLAAIGALVAAGAPLAAQNPPSLSKLFTDDPVLPGANVTLEFTLSHTEGDVVDPATDIAFTDDLDAVLPGAPDLGIVSSLPIGVCGGTLAALGNVLDFSGGSLAAGASCSFSVTLSVPFASPIGSFPNSTSALGATVGGMALVGPPATDDLDVTSLSITKSFLDDPAIPGGTVTLEIVLANQSATTSATSIAFTDDLAATVTGLAYNGGDLNPACANGSGLLTGTSTVSFSGGSLAPGESCVLTLVLDVPGAASAGDYGNTTSPLTADIDGSPVVLAGASDLLTLATVLLALEKEFTDDPVAPGDLVTMAIGVVNLHPTRAASAVALSDDLGAALSGLSLDAVLANDCGFAIAGLTNLSFTGGALPPLGACAVQLSLQVPAAAPGGTFTNTTSGATATMDGLAVVGSAASDDLRVLAVSLEKAFGSAATPGGTVQLVFTLTNLDAGAPVTGLGFVDDLAATLSGLVATGLPMSDVCGGGSTLAGVSVLTLSGGSLQAAGSAGDSCTFAVTLSVPAGSSTGSYLNTTGSLFSAGIEVGDPATAMLVVEPVPGFAKAFAPSPIVAGDISRLTLTVDNSGSTLTATDLDFTDMLPAGVVVATPPNAVTSCAGGTLTAAAGGGTVEYTGGSLAAGGTCEVAVDVTSAVVGVHVNTTGDLTSSSGNSGPASATLAVGPAPPVEVPAVSPHLLAVLAALLAVVGVTTAAKGARARR